MSSKSRTRTQAARDKKSLRRLRDLGLYTGKADLRKKTTPYQKSLIAKFSDVLRGKAAVVEPKNPKSYAGLYEVKGTKVVVPRRKGEKIYVSKQGNIAGERRNAAGKKTRFTFKKTPVGKIPEKPKRKVQYTIPFIRGRDENGRALLTWFRFPDYEAMRAYMSGSASIRGYENWPDYVVEEYADEPLSDEQLQDQLDKRKLKVQLRESTDTWRKSRKKTKREKRRGRK